MDDFILPAQTKIAHAHLKVASLERSLPFYVGLLGLSQVTQKDDTAYLSATGEPPSLLLLTQIQDALPRPRRSTGLFHVAIRLPDRVALARTLFQLLTHDWPLQGAADHVVSEALYLADPDGNGLELYVDRPRHQWPRNEDQIAMTTLPLDLEALLGELAGQDQTYSGIHPQTDVGHVHLQVSSLEGADRFYHQLLGLEVTQRDFHGALFLAAGGYHHHLGVNIWNSAGAGPPPPNAVGLRSYAYHIPDEGTWLALHQRLEVGGHPIEKYTDDGVALSAHLHDADHIQVELLIDRQQLSPATLARVQAESGQ